MINSSKIASIITVRSASSRLPEKCFLSFGTSSILEHVVTRAKHYGLLPIICTTRESEDDRIVEIAERLGVLFYRGPTDNKLLRWHECCEFFGIDAFHSIDADDPFFCGDEVKRSFELLQSGYDFVAPSPSSSAGGATVGYSLNAELIRRACAGLARDADTEMMWSYVERLQGIKKITLSEPGKYVIRARMTLDYWEDYIFLEAVRLILGNLASRSDVAELLEKNPYFERINSFRAVEWSARQQLKSSTEF